MQKPIECIISTSREQFYGVLVPLCDAMASTGSNPVSPTIKKRGNAMHPLELAAEVVREKSQKRMNEKADIFLHALLHTREGQRIRRIIIPKIAKGIGAYEPLG